MQESHGAGALKKSLFKSASWMTRPVSLLGKHAYRLGKHVEFRRDWSWAPNPEWFDHELDLVFFDKWRRPHYFERGVYASEIVKSKRVLDICCGDGSIAALFVSPLATSVYAVDFDPAAIAQARAKWGRYPNVSYELQDIREMKPRPASFDVCLWEAAIEHFTQAEMNVVFGMIKSGLTEGGILHGHTIKKQEHESHHDHEYEFSSREELSAFLSNHFRHVLTWEREHPDRTSYYFRCSDVSIRR